MRKGDAYRGVATGGKAVLGVAALAVTAYWALASLPTAADEAAVEFGAVSLAGSPTPDAFGRVEVSLGCAESTSTGDLNDFFAERRGPLVGWDNPHVTELGPGRWLWLVHDTYLDYSGRASDLEAVGSQIQNAAFVQEANCFSLLHRGTPEQRQNFEHGDGSLPAGSFLWPLGSEVVDDRLWVFWGETVTAETPPPHGHGISRHPVATWLASYDRETLERLTFAPAPNAGVEPVYGFAVASDDTHTYLFGNTNQLNFWRDGGYDNGPHSATRMYLARVDRGQLEQLPDYWNGTGWSPDAGDAVPISERFWAENTMQPRFIDGRWFSVVQPDGFFGTDVWLEAARDPWGPWVAVETVRHNPRSAAVAKNSYQPILLPWSSPENGMQVIISENAVKWFHALDEPSLYRPAVFGLDWPTNSHQRIDDAIARFADG